MKLDLKVRYKKSKDLLMVVQSLHFGEVIEIKVQPHLQQNIVLYGQQGLERHTGRLFCKLLWRKNRQTISSCSTFWTNFLPKELAAGLPTARPLASNNEQFALEVSSSYLFTVVSIFEYISTKMIGN